ncbi:MAG TPA: hypothetical protein VH092_25505, partial [Urbifossiella sp.]|nr:hypothetical protein [Urbifossiella sp.]
GPLHGLGADRWEFQRGFPEEVQTRSHDYVREVDQLTAVTPVSRLHLTGNLTPDAAADLAALGRLPAVGRLVALRLENHRVDAFGPDGVRALAASPHLTRLRELTLESPNADAGVVGVIAASPAFAGLRRLELPHPGTDTQECAEQLLRSPYLGDLDWVRLGDRPPFSPVYTRRSTPAFRPGGDGRPR